MTDTDTDTADEIAALKAAVAALQLRLDPPKPEPFKVDSRPEKTQETHEDYLLRIASQAQAHKALEKSYMAKRTEGMPVGQYMDDCGLARFIKNGKIVPTGRALEQQIAKAKEHEEAVIAEDRAWRKAVELPWRGADDAD
jgi:hypothetical protein